MNAKKLWWIAGSILMAGLVAAAVWWLWRPPSITLANGAKLTLLGVTYGKHHVPPKSATANGRRARGGMFGDSTNDYLVVWIRQQHKPNEWPNYQLYAYDRKGVACAGFSGMTYVNNNNRQQGNEVVGIRLDAFPRREGKFKLRLQEWNSRDGRQTVRDAFTISNPARGHFPTWYPDPLPMTQSDGDLDVTLTKLAAGAQTPFQRNRDEPGDAMNKGVQVAFDAQQNGHPATNWQAVQVITSDATGNRISGWVNQVSQGNDPMTVYQWGLWPDEPAWKVRFEFSRTSGFRDDELWRVQNLPLTADKMQNFWNYNGRTRTNAFAEATVNGISLKIFPAKKFTDQQGGMGQIEGGLIIQTKPALDGMRMTLVSIADEQGRAIQPMNWGWGGTEYRYGLREIGDAKTLNITVALHKSRFVEFAVKPGKP
jgi:hypothetical protein